MSSATFSQTRTQALNLEKKTESLLSRYSKYQNSDISGEANDEETQLVEEITDLLTKRDSLINKLNRISDSDSNISTSKLQQLTRHKEILNDQKLSFSKIQSKILDERNRSNLLFLVRSDINAHKQRSTNYQQNSFNDNDYILDERTRVDNTNSFADRLLRSAYETRDELLQQRVHLNNASSKMMGVLSSIPGINVLISKINTRRKRDTLILASVISVCILFLFFF